jgi:ankyrin repeat protein
MKVLRAIAIRGGAVLITLTIAVSLTFARRFYVYRHPLFADAAFMGRFTRMKLLYSLGLDVNGQCPYRSCFTPLWGAAYGGYDDEVRFLLGRGADVNRKSNFDGTPLMIAAYKGHESTVRLLLSRGADVNAELDGVDTALTLARKRHHRRIVELLRQAGACETR